MGIEGEGKLHVSRAELEQRASEHNAKVDLAYLRLRNALIKLIEMPDEYQDELVQIIGDLRYHTQIATDGLWLTSMIETGGDIVRTWDLVGQKRGQERDKLDDAINKRQENPNS